MNALINDITDSNVIIETLKREFPELQAVYLFGSYGTPDEKECSDVDIAFWRYQCRKLQ